MYFELFQQTVSQEIPWCTIFMNKLITTVLKSVGSVKITLQQFNHPTGKYLNKIIELLETIILGVDSEM